MTSTDDVQPNRLLIAAIFVTIGGGLVVAIGDVMDMPFWLALVGLTAFLVGCATAGVLCFRASRREGVSFFRALGRALRSGVRWLWEFLP